MPSKKNDGPAALTTHKALYVLLTSPDIMASLPPQPLQIPPLTSDDACGSSSSSVNSITDCDSHSEQHDQERIALDVPPASAPVALSIDATQSTHLDSVHAAASSRFYPLLPVAVSNPAIDAASTHPLSSTAHDYSAPASVSYTIASLEHLPLPGFRAASRDHSAISVCINEETESQNATLPRLESLDMHCSYGNTTSHDTFVHSNGVRRPALTLHAKSSTQSLRPVSRTPSLKARNICNPFGSTSATSSTVPSPVISAMGEVTPLPSPLLGSDSPTPWKHLMGRKASRDTSFACPTPSPDVDGAPSATPSRSASIKKPYAGLTTWPTLDNTPEESQPATPVKPASGHTRNRSISDYRPDSVLIPKRTPTVSGTRPKDINPKSVAGDGRLRREPHLAGARGLTSIEKPPTPPPSESSLSIADSGYMTSSGSSNPPCISKSADVEYFEAYDRYDSKLRRWRAIRVLGQGTFSQVVLATSQTTATAPDEDGTGAHADISSPSKHDRRSLVAVKICEHGPRGGASEQRIEMSLKRELEIMKDIRHPSLVHLKAWNIDQSRAILVLSYYPGGDLFDLASNHRDILTQSLLRRMFSELVGAVRYLHDRNIVHRDIKLENVLVNLPAKELADSDMDWTTYPYPVVTLTDLGLSRRVAPDEKLETRCGSDDYAAPEVIMGQPYDGRATDAWSLGVLLYALMESRLPFDPPPNLVGDYAVHMRMRSRTSHRIARVEWRWYLYGVDDGHQDDADGDHDADPAKFAAAGLQGACEAVEGLLKRARNRWPLAKIAEIEWVKGGINVPGGIRFREEEEGEEVLAQ